MGIRGMAEGLQKPHMKRSHPLQGSNGAVSCSSGKSVQALLRHFMEVLDHLEIIIRNMHQTGASPMACALKSRLSTMRSCIDTAMATPQKGTSLREILLFCTAESERMLNLLECTGDVPDRSDQ